MKNIEQELKGIVLSVDSNEWYYGRPESRTDPLKRILVSSPIPLDATFSEQQAHEINNYFIWTESHERDTIKKKKRPLYVDRGFFINPSFRL